MLKTKASYRWHYANLRPRTRAESAARQAALNYHNTVPQETRDGIADLENQARDIRKRTSTEGVDAQFEWIPDPRLTRARENLYNRTMELSWNVKTIMGLVMQENIQASKTMDDKLDKLNEKYTVCVETFHHMRFVTRDSLHFTLLKRRMATSQGGKEITPRIKREPGGTSASQRSARALLQEVLQRCPSCWKRTTLSDLSLVQSVSTQFWFHALWACYFCPFDQKAKGQTICRSHGNLDEGYTIT